MWEDTNGGKWTGVKAWLDHRFEKESPFIAQVFLHELSWGVVTYVIDLAVKRSSVSSALTYGKANARDTIIAIDTRQGWQAGSWSDCSWLVPLALDFH